MCERVVSNGHPDRGQKGHASRRPSRVESIENDGSVNVIGTVMFVDRLA